MLQEKLRCMRNEVKMLLCHVLQLKSHLHYLDFFKNADLDAEDYADLISYLHKAGSTESIILSDSNNALHGLTMAPLSMNDIENTWFHGWGVYFCIFGEKVELINDILILFPETYVIACSHAATHPSKFTCAIYCTRKIIVFSHMINFSLSIICMKFEM